VGGVEEGESAVGSMPNWFAKTKEMAAFDRYFSLIDVDEKRLLGRYLAALKRLNGSRTRYYAASDALNTQWAAHPNVQQEISGSLDAHFRGDWIHHLYPTDPAQYGDVGGRFWPQVPSTRVLEMLRVGTIFAIHKAMGETELINLGLPDHYRHRLWKAERDNGIANDDGIRPIAMSWNCVAPAGECYFEVDALRGPSVVEFAIATPRPFGHSTVMGVAEDVEADLVENFAGEPRQSDS
jgi:hypothetical protein